MDANSFFSRKFVVVCPVWLMVKAEKGQPRMSSVMTLDGEPELGRFLPIFLDPTVGQRIAKNLNLKIGLSGLKIGSASELLKVLVWLQRNLSEVKNAVIYFKKGKTRFYRIEDLQEELESYRNN